MNTKRRISRRVKGLGALCLIFTCLHVAVVLVGWALGAVDAVSTVAEFTGCLVVASCVYLACDCAINYIIRRLQAGGTST